MIQSRFCRIGETALRLCEQMKRVLPNLTDLQVEALMYRIESFCCSQVERYRSSDDIVGILEKVTLFFDHPDKVQAIRIRCPRNEPTYDNVIKIANLFCFTHQEAKLIWDVVYEIDTRR